MVSKDYEALESHRFLPGQRVRTYNLIVELPDVAAARQARQAVRATGIADEDVSILGLLGEEVSTVSGLARDERLFAGTMAWRIALGALAGAVLGAAADAMIGLETIGKGGLWEVLLAGLIFGAIVGALIAGMGATGLGLSRQDLHRGHPELEHVMLGVHATHPEDLDRAEAALRPLAPLGMERLAAPSGSDASPA